MQRGHLELNTSENPESHSTEKLKWEPFGLVELCKHEKLSARGCIPHDTAPEPRYFSTRPSGTTWLSKKLLFSLVTGRKCQKNPFLEKEK